MIPLVDRSVYPQAQYPAGQWEYQLFYEESFDAARRGFEANVRNTVKALFRKGAPAPRASRLAPRRSATTPAGSGSGSGPDLPRDTDVLTEEDLHRYAAALEGNGFFGPDSWYMNSERNLQFAAQAIDGGKLRMPVLFLHGEYDYTCETVSSRLADPMRQDCQNLTEVVVQSGHWMAQEKPLAVNAALAKWLSARIPRAVDGVTRGDSPALHTPR